MHLYSAIKSWLQRCVAVTPICVEQQLKLIKLNQICLQYRLSDCNLVRLKCNMGRVHCIDSSHHFLNDKDQIPVVGCGPWAKCAICDCLVEIKRLSNRIDGIEDSTPLWYEQVDKQLTSPECTSPPHGAEIGTVSLPHSFSHCAITVFLKFTPTVQSYIAKRRRDLDMRTWPR